MAAESESSGVSDGSPLSAVGDFREQYRWTFRGLIVLGFVCFVGFIIGVGYGVPGLINGAAKHLVVFLVYAALVWALVANVDEVAYFRREYFFTWTFLVIMGAATVEALLITTMGFAEYAGIILAQQVFLLVYATIIWGVVLYLKRRLA
jgi:hypothetical protein